MESQAERILHYLQHGGKLTPQDALRQYGCFRLAARINDLKRDGHPVQSELVKRGDATVAEYSLATGELFATPARWE